MKTARKIILALMTVLAVMSISSVVFAEDAITVDSIDFFEYVDEVGAKDDSLVSVKVSFTAVSSDQVTILLTSEDIPEISLETIPKIIYMNQSVNPEEGYYEFSIEKSRIASATGLDDIEGCTLYLKIGGTNVSDMVTQTLTYNDPALTNFTLGDVDNDGEISSRDAIFLLRYLVDGGFDNISVKAMDIDGDNEISNRDATTLLRYVAGWDIELK